MTISAQGGPAARPAAGDGVPGHIIDQYGLLPAQAGFVYNHLRGPAAGVDVVQVVISAEGERPRREAWELAWRRAAARHDALRTSFRFDAAGEPSQEVRGEVEVSIDWRTAADGARDESGRTPLEAYLRADRARSFDVSGILFRVAVLESPSGYTMIFTHHHAVLDGRSLKILFTEVFEDYAAICEGTTKQFEPSRRYRDFVDWWQRLDLSEARQFWSRFLDGVAQPAVSLPGAIGAITDSGSGSVPQPRRPRDRMAEPTAREMVLDLDFSASLRDAARRHGVTIATLVNAAWAVALGRYRASDDVLFAVTRSCRFGTVEGADQMVGMLINSVPLRVRLDPELTIGDLLRQVYQRGTQVREHQLAPLGDIQRWGGVPAGMPDTLVVFDRERLGSTLAKVGPQFANRTVTMHRLPSFTTTLYGFDEPAIRILLIFDQHRFDNHTAGVVLGHVRRILEAFAGDPSVRLADIDLADDAERNRVVSIWNQTRFRYPREATVPECFARQAAATPDAVAVSFGGATLTYAELDARANQLAHELRDRGVGLEAPVAVALPRSLDLVVALLAVMKAGGAYVPLDLANPPARSAYVLSDCGASLVITEAARAGQYGDVPVLAIDTAAGKLAAQPVTSPECPATAENLAYLCYTSGSTGMPKGTAVPHRGVVRLVHQPGYATLGPGETILQLCAVAFDVSVFELWGALLTGARLAVAPPGPLTLPQIAETLRTEGVTTLWLTAGLFHQIVELDVDCLAGVRQLLAGGDVIAPGAVRAALRARGNLPVINGYGPTENTTFATCYRMTDPAQAGDRTPIGTPIPQSTAYVLDEALRPLPIGVAGELCLGGDGVARGYLNRPALTATKFVPDPFSSIPGARMYRTGDLARWRADGVLEFLGRLDGQVKIRGFRVEPGEVEAVLRGRREVHEAAVVVRGDGEAKHLAAYVTVTGGDPVAVTGALREHLVRQLPDYLVPSSITVLDELPLNISGKVDKRALPDPGSEPPRTVSAPAAAAATPLASPTQRRLAEIWREILRIEHVEATDDFFNIGGNSLAATRLIFRLRDAFGVDLPLLTLYDEPTLEQTAAAIDSLLPGGPQVATGDGAATSDDPATVAPDGGTRTAPTGSTPASIGITRRDRSAMRTNMAAPSSPAAPSPAAPSPAAPSPRPVAPTAVTASVVPPDPSAPGAPDHLIPLAPGWGLWRWVCLRAAGFPFQMHASVAGEALADAADQLVAASTSESPGAQRLAEAYDAQFAVSERELASALHAVGADPRFRTAVAWQNRTAMETGIDVLLRRDPLTVKRNGNYRRYEALIANYLQRYTAKNDSIGFFGPIGWVDVTADGPAITHRPHPPGALARRRLYFEEWAIQRLAESLSSGLDRWLVPRRLPLVSIEPGPDGPVLRIPFAPPTSVDPLAAEVYAQIDGARDAAEVVARVLAEAAGPVTEASVWAALGALRDLHVIAWQLEVAADDAWAAQSLRAHLSTVDDPALRDPALAVLDELEAGKAVVDAASESGDPAALITSLASLDETFTRLTGAAATRRPGAMYAGRTLVFEECLRPDDVAFSRKLFDTLAAPLEIVLHAARWYTTAGAALFHRACLTVYRDRVSAAGSARIPLSEFWLDASSLIFDVHGKTVGPIGKVIRDRWAPVLGVPADVRRHQLSSADIRDAALRAFAVSQPGWGAAREHSPDLMIAAENAAAIRNGDFLWVLGEIHPGMNTMRYATWVDYHPEPDAMRQAMRADLGQPVAWHVQTAAFGSTPARLSNVLMGPQDWRVVFAPDSSGYDPRLARFVGDFDIEEIDGRLIVTSRVTGESMPFVELIADPLSSSLSQYFGLVPAGPHTPRITVDNLVIQRETWRFDAGTLTFAHIVDEKARYVEIRRWILANDLPRYVFVRAQGEVKPIFVDLTSLSSVDLMCRLARRVKANHGDQGQLSVSEMLPTPDQLWLTDSQGRRYTSELRVCAADLLGRN